MFSFCFAWQNHTFIFHIHLYIFTKSSKYECLYLIIRIINVFITRLQGSCFVMLVFADF